MPSIPIKSFVTPAVAWALLVAPAWAERADRDQPTQIDADALRYEDKTQLSTFTGRVLVTKGTMTMRGAQLEVRQDAAGNQHGVMRAGPNERAFFRQKREGVNEYVEAEGETIDYDSKTDTVRVTGRAEMRRLAGAALQDQMKGAVIVYNNVTEVYTVESGAGAPSAATGGRISMVLAPRAATASAPAGAASMPLQPSPALPVSSAPQPGASQ